jgi:hypothetical protein
MKKSYALIIMLSLILVSSCGKGGGGGSPQETSKEPVISNCMKMVGKYSLKAIAVEASRARVECGMREEDIVAQLVKP